MIILMSIWIVLIELKKKNYLLKNIFTALERMEKIGDDGKVSDSHISVKDYLMCEKTWDKFGMKNMGYYHDH